MVLLFCDFKLGCQIIIPLLTPGATDIYCSVDPIVHVTLKENFSSFVGGFTSSCWKQTWNFRARGQFFTFKLSCFNLLFVSKSDHDDSVAFFIKGVSSCQEIQVTVKSGSLENFICTLDWLPQTFFSLEIYFTSTPLLSSFLAMPILYEVSRCQRYSLKISSWVPKNI